ncbi:MAG TPA: TlyA family RNA methyltransferase [Spirochaetia bacterium]|nr:TlyA family RNA methyltransferase [Spirochaetia bacterium]
MKHRTLLQAVVAAFPGLTKEQAYAAILCGDILVDGARVRDPKHVTAPVSRVERMAEPFVSRGGLKLEHALAAWEISVAGKVFIDAGASTGGFTDCLLRRGAKMVHAVDVGTNQLAYSLRTDSRVIVHERTNITSVASLVPEADAAVADLSFRSLRGAARHLLSLTKEGWLIMLIKPQFELRAPGRDFRGIIHEDGTVGRVLLEVLDGLWSEGVYVSRIARSPITGRRGNREFLALAKSNPDLAREELIVLTADPELF